MSTWTGNVAVAALGHRTQVIDPRRNILGDRLQEKAFPAGSRLLFKLETAQVAGCYKMRGIVNQLDKAKRGWKEGERPHLVTLSAGEIGDRFTLH